MKNQILKYAVKTNVVIILLILACAFPVIAGAAQTETKNNNTITATQYKAEETTETAPKVKPTTIRLNKHSVKLFIKNQFTIKPTVTNLSGSIKYTVKNSKIASVNNKGVVTAKKKGTTTIRVNNNGAVATLKVKVKKPYLTKKGKAVRSITVNRNKSTTVRINCGKIKSIKYRCTKSVVITSRTGNVITVKGKKETPKNKPATIRITVNGVKFNLKVKVSAKTNYQKYVNVSYKLKKSKISRIYKNTINIKGLYSVKTNLDKLLKAKRITRAQYNKYKKTAASASYSVSNTKILKLNRKKATVKCKGKGTSYVTVKFKDGTKLKIKITVTKPIKVKVSVPYYAWNGTKEYVKYTDKDYAKVCYSYEEAYKALRNEFYSHIIKGEKPEYPYLSFAFGKVNNSKLLSEVIKRARRDYADGYNFYNYIEGGNCNSDLCILFGKAGATTVVVGRRTTNLWEDSDKDYTSQFKYNKQLYNAAQSIFKNINISKFTEDYKKATVLAVWMKKNYSYDYSDSSYDDIPIYQLLINKKGTCHEWANATDYFLTLLHIPSYYITGNTEDDIYHAWNAVKVQGKWYHLDILWTLMFEGNDDVKKNKWHKSFHLFSEIDQLQKTSFLNNKIGNNFWIALNGSNLTYTTDYFDESFGW